MAEYKRVTLNIHQEQYELIEAMSKKMGESVSEVARTLIYKGLDERVLEQNTDLIASIVRSQMEIVIKPHVERLASLSAKSGHMSATAAFLNVQALIDLVPSERRKDAKDMYASARKKAAEYMRTSTNQENE